MLVGVLCWRSRFVPRWIGVLVALAGAAYAVDSIGVLVSDSYDVELAAFLFVGEVALMVWLIWWGLRGGVVSQARAWRPSHLNYRSARWLRCEERQRRASKPPPAQPVAPNCSTRIAAASTPHSSSNPSAYSAKRDEPQT